MNTLLENELEGIENEILYLLDRINLLKIREQIINNILESDATG